MVHSLTLVVRVVVVTARLPCVDWEQQDREMRAVMGWPPPIRMLVQVVEVKVLTDRTLLERLLHGLLLLVLAV
jgi:hypothetical protein